MHGSDGSHSRRPPHAPQGAYMTRKRMIVAVLAAALCTGVAVTDSLARGGGGGGGGGGHGGGFGGGGDGGGVGGGHMGGFGGGHFGGAHIGGGHFGGAHFGGRALGHVGRIGGVGRG